MFDVVFVSSIVLCGDRAMSGVMCGGWRADVVSIDLWADEIGVDGGKLVWRRGC